MTTTTILPNGNKIYPGLVCRSIEFFIDDNGIFQVLSSGNVKEFSKAPYSYHQILKEAIEQDPEAAKILHEWHPTSELQRLVQFGKCRFGGLDFKGDVIDFELQKGEYVECAARDTCPAAGILCHKPVVNGLELSFMEVKVLKALATIETNEAIAENLNIKLGSFHLLKRNLYEKLKIQTKQEAVMIGRDHNLL